MFATIPVWLVEVRTGDDEWIAHAPVWFGLDAARSAAQYRRDMGDTVRISEGRLTRLGTVEGERNGDVMMDRRDEALRWVYLAMGMIGPGSKAEDINRHARRAAEIAGVDLPADVAAVFMPFDEAKTRLEELAIMIIENVSSAPVTPCEALCYLQARVDRLERLLLGRA